MDRIDDLVAAHPALFRGRAPSAFSDLPAGWYDLADRLCVDIEAELGAEPQRFAVTQIKEKFGTLRFYFALEGAEDFYMDIRGTDGVRTTVNRADGPPTMDRLRKLVRDASERSAALCQECGEVGQASVHDGWVQTLCTRHAQERAARVST